MDALGFDLQGDFNGFVVTFHGQDIGKFSSWLLAVEHLKAQRGIARLALAMLDQTLSERKTA